MKKLIVVLLLIFLFSTAYADTITIDIDSATLEELLALRNTLDARITEIQSTPTSTNDHSHIISGEGTQILGEIELVSPLTRFVGICDQEFKVTRYIGNDSRTYSGYYASYQSFADYLIDPVSISALMIETPGKWSLDISPIEVMDTPYASGIGSFISDAFVTNPPYIISIAFSGNNLKWKTFEVRLNKIYSNGSIRYETMINKNQGDDTEVFDIIIKPENDVVAYFWEFQCPFDINWTISSK